MFVNVTNCVALVALAATLPKPRLVGETVDETIPVPVSVTVCGLLLAVWVMVSDAGAPLPW